MNNRIFDINSTNACKGVALILLLWHHLFCKYPEYGFIVYETAQFAKVCVAIFVILSGYGFSETVKRKNDGVLNFYKTRLIRIYSNYWFIALLFVPICAFFTGRTLESVFISHPYAKFAVQMTGLYEIVYSGHGYNPTWWYMSAIIPLIVLFPFINCVVKRYGFFAVLCFFAFFLRPMIPVFDPWLLPFALGIYLSQRNGISAASNYLCTWGVSRYFLLLFMIILIAVVRAHGGSLKGVRIDGLLGFLIILFSFELIMSIQSVGKILRRLGDHLFNIFLFHTFIYLYLLKDFIYSFKQPVLIFVILLSICIVLSEIIEFLKRSIGFYSVTQKLQSMRMPASLKWNFHG
jgi:hypothetical protein